MLSIGNSWASCFITQPVLRWVKGKVDLAWVCRLLFFSEWLFTVSRKGPHNFAVAVKPRFPPDHITEVFIWAGKTRNITCHIRAEPLPAIEWLHHGRALVNNETYRIYVMSKDTNLQVILCLYTLTKICGIVNCILPSSFFVASGVFVLLWNGLLCMTGMLNLTFDFFLKFGRGVCFGMGNSWSEFGAVPKIVWGSAQNLACVPFWYLFPLAELKLLLIAISFCRPGQVVFISCLISRCW